MTIYLRLQGNIAEGVPKAMLPKLAAVSFVGDSSSERKRWPAGRRVREDAASLFLLDLPSSILFPRPLLSFSLARSLDVKRETLNKTGCY